MKCISIAQGKDLLLEIHAEICGHHGLTQRGRNCPRLQGLPVLREANPPASSGPANDAHYVAFQGVGGGYGRASVKGTRGVHAPTCRSRQFHQMDRGEVDHYN